MKKFRLLFDKDKEIKWLNEMAEQGWNLTDFRLGVYTFAPCQPGEYVYEADLKDQATSLSPEYRAILEEQDIEMIPTFGLWFLARRKRSLGPLHLYTDVQSQIEQYKRIRKMFLDFTIFCFVMLLLEIFCWYVARSWLLLVCVILITAIVLTMASQVHDVSRKIRDLEGRIS